MRTQKQNENLAKLAKYLLALPKDYEQFDMRVYRGRVSEEECGTVACALGHGPAAGVPKEHDMPWETYAIEKVTNSRAEFRWLFSDEWFWIDNTPFGAGKRILALLTQGLTEDMREVFDTKIYGTALFNEKYKRALGFLDAATLNQPERWVS